MKASPALSGRGNEKTPGASGAGGGLVHELDVSVKGSRGMAHVASGSVVRQLGSLFEGGSAAGLSDRQLLERFTARGEPADEAAFAAMVARHGPMVLGVCRQLLGDHHHAEDAFQAVFLVLARKARSIRDPDLLGNWLYGVALRTARKARGRLARRRRTEEERAARQPTAGPAAAGRAGDARPRAGRGAASRDRPLAGRLPRAGGALLLRGPHARRGGAAAAMARRHAPQPAGPGREKLRRGLTRRGFALSTTALAAALAPRSASASVSSLLCDTTTRAAIRFAARHAAGGALSAPAAALAQEVLRSMLDPQAQAHRAVPVAPRRRRHRRRLAHPPAGDRRMSPAGRPRQLDSRSRPGPTTQPLPGPGPDDRRRPRARPAGQAGAERVGDGLRGAQAGATTGPARCAPSAIGQAASDGSGRFRLDMPRISSSTHHMVGAAAIAPGYGVGWVDLDLDADQPAADITLRPEQVIEGRLFDVQGRPVRGVRVSVEAMGHPRRGPEAHPRARRRSPFLGQGVPRRPRRPGPRPAITDAEGRFTIRGVGRDLRVLLVADDPRFARQRIVVDTDGTAGAQASHRGRGAGQGHHRPRHLCRHRQARPACDRRRSAPIERRRPGYTNDYETDAQGRFRANPCLGRPLRGRRLRPRGPALSERVVGDLRVAQGGARARRRPGLAPGHGDPRQGDRGGLGPAGRRGAARLSSGGRPGAGCPAPGAAPRGRGRMARTSSRSCPTRAP